jgi:hypothetical protein
MCFYSNLVTRDAFCFLSTLPLWRPPRVSTLQASDSVQLSIHLVCASSSPVPADTVLPGVLWLIAARVRTSRTKLVLKGPSTTTAHTALAWTCHSESSCSMPSSPSVTSARGPRSRYFPHARNAKCAHPFRPRCSRHYLVIITHIGCQILQSSLPEGVLRDHCSVRRLTSRCSETGRKGIAFSAHASQTVVTRQPPSARAPPKECMPPFSFLSSSVLKWPLAGAPRVAFHTIPKGPASGQSR